MNLWQSALFWLGDSFCVQGAAGSLPVNEPFTAHYEFFIAPFTDFVRIRLAPDTLKRSVNVIARRLQGWRSYFTPQREDFAVEHSQISRECSPRNDEIIISFVIRD